MGLVGVGGFFVGEGRGKREGLQSWSKSYDRIGLAEMAKPEFHRKER